MSSISDYIKSHAETGKIVVVYSGRAGRENFDHGIQNGVWGFNLKAKSNDPVSVGDLILFGHGYSGKNIRIEEGRWRKNTLSGVSIARVTAELKPEDSFEWPDEIREKAVKYPIRLKFDNQKSFAGPISLDSDGSLPDEVVIALRRAAIGNKAQVVTLGSKAAKVQPSKSKAAKVGDKPQSGKFSKPQDVITALAEIGNWMAAQGFVFDPNSVANLYAALRSKPFVILAGNSGTGKSRLIRLFAEASGATAENGGFRMIPVRPDWNDGAELLGYFDLNGKFQPGQIVPSLLRAHKNPEQPFFVCLDEMNLARVEHYFSDFLSVVESRRFDGGRVISDPMLNNQQLAKMALEHLEDDAKAAAEHFRARGRTLGLPDNLFIVGTVNMDETTQPFSRKVLDRACTIEFNDIDLLQNLDESGAADAVQPLKLGSDFFLPELVGMVALLKNNRATFEEVSKRLHELNQILNRGGFEVGYRVRDEATAFVVYAEMAGLGRDEALELVVLQKILPRLQGSSPRLERVLQELLARFAATAPDFSGAQVAEALVTLQQEASTSQLVRKLCGMLLVFREDNFTSFWLA